VRLSDGKEVYKFKVGSGIIGNVFSYELRGKQFVGVLSGIGGWAGIGTAADLENPACWSPLDSGWNCNSRSTKKGGNLIVFALPDDVAFPKESKPGVTP
jgi:glucose dehydrogenase